MTMQTNFNQMKKIDQELYNGRISSFHEESSHTALIFI